MRGLEIARIGVMLAMVVAGGVGMTYAMLPPPKVEAKLVPTPKLRVAGQDLAEDGDMNAKALDLVRKYALGEAKLKIPASNGKEARTIKLTRADFGVEIDRLRITEFVKAALEKGSVVQRAHALSEHPEAPLDVPLPIKLDTERAVAKLVDLKAEVDTFPVDAIVDVKARVVKPEQVGYRLDVYGTIAKIEAGFRAGLTEIEADVEEVKPRRVAKELEGLEFSHVLGYYETHYNRGPEFADRARNLRTAASHLDGTVLMPGEIFDFNQVVGPRDEAHGYHLAKVIAEGELVDGIGGGTCQISGTLYAAAMFAGLDIVERYPHSRPSSYIQLGLDATVAYPNITFRFRNPFDFPIVIHEEVVDGNVRAQILGKARRLTTTFFRRIDGMIPFDELERESPKLARGERVVVQRGIPGFRATTSRVVRDGAYADRTVWNEKYPPTTQIVAVGTGPEDMKPGIFEDNHPEYTLDEYWVVTQGPGIKTPGKTDDPDGGMVEQRTPGRTREAGWMKKLGFEKTPIGVHGDPDKDDGDKKDGDKKDGDKKDGDKKDGDKKDGDKKGDKKKKPTSKKDKTAKREDGPN
ncbi:MAG: VanW family protein [Polyangiaceae bacterium]